MPTQVRGEQGNIYHGGSQTAGGGARDIHKLIEYAYTGKRRAWK